MKLRDNKGETLVEVLASILIAALSVTLMFGCVMASSRMDETAKAVDEKYYADLSEADSQIIPTPEGDPEPIPPGNVIIKRTDPGPAASMSLVIEIYGDNGVYSYKRK